MVEGVAGLTVDVDLLSSGMLATRELATYVGDEWGVDSEVGEDGRMSSCGAKSGAGSSSPSVPVVVMVIWDEDWSAVRHDSASEVMGGEVGRVKPNVLVLNLLLARERGRAPILPKLVSDRDDASEAVLPWA